MDLRPKCKAGYYKTLRGKHRTLFYINHSKIFFDPPPIVMKIKTRQMGPTETSKLLHSKRNHKQDEKIKMGENICMNQLRRDNVQNIQIAQYQTTQLKSRWKT